MGAQTIPLTLKGSGDHQEALASIELDERWAHAEREGLLHRQVFVDPKDPTKAELHLRWTSLDAAESWEQAGPGLDFGNEIETGQPTNMVSAGRQTPRRRDG